MELVLYPSPKADTFAALFQHVRLFCDHINLVFDSNQLYMQCMDNAHVAIMEFYLPAAWFDRYETINSITIGLNAGHLYRILASREKDQQMHLVYSDKDTDRILIHLTSPQMSSENSVQTKSAKTSFDKHFELPLMDLESDTMEIPEIEYVAELSISSPHFAGIINQLKMFGDTMDIQCSEDKIVLASNSQDQGKMFVEINIDDVSAFAIDEGSNLNLSFSLTYLHHVCMYNKLAKEVELKFSDSYPMQIVYVLAKDVSRSDLSTKDVSRSDLSTKDLSTQSQDAKLVLYLAPKINDND